MVDELTGALNGKGFRQMAIRDLHLAEQYDLLTFLVEVELAADDPDPDLAAIRLVDCLYRERTEGDLLGRLDERVFTMAGLGENEVDVDLRLQRLEAVLSAYGKVECVSGSEAHEALCDNSGVENRVGRHLQRRAHLSGVGVYSREILRAWRAPTTRAGCGVTTVHTGSYDRSKSACLPAAGGD